MKRHEWVKFLMNTSVNILIDDLLGIVADYMPWSHVFDRETCDSGVVISADGRTASGNGYAWSKYSLKNGEHVFTFECSKILHGNPAKIGLVSKCKMGWRLSWDRISWNVNVGGKYQTECIPSHVNGHSESSNQPGKICLYIREDEVDALYPTVMCEAGSTFTFE